MLPAPGALFGALAVALCCSLACPASYAQIYIEVSDWGARAPSHSPRSEGAAIVYDGKLYALAGFELDVKATSISEVYDPATGEWSLLAPIPYPVTHVGAVLIDGRIWILGGFEGDHPGVSVDRVQIYDIDLDTWTDGPALPKPRASGGAALIGRSLHYLGGLEADRQTDTGEHFVLNVDRWEDGWAPAPDFPNPRNHFATVAHDEKIYVIGGQFGHDESYTLTPLVHAYDPNARTWLPLADLPLERSHAEASTFVHEDRIVVAGGTGPGPRREASLDLITSYDPASDQWTEMGKLPVPLHGLGAAIMGDHMYAANGSVGLTQYAQSAVWWAPLTPREPGTCEIGTVAVSQTSAAEWHTMYLDGSFTHPIVVMSPPSYNGGNPSVMRVREVTASSFQFQIDEWDYLDGAHAAETIHYAVFEAGTDPDGVELEAGAASAGTTPQTIGFSTPFSTSPVVLAQIISSNDASAAVARVHNVTAAGFDLMLQPQEANSDHADENVAYVAIAPGNGKLCGYSFIAGTTPQEVTHSFSAVPFNPAFSTPPVFLASIQTLLGSDTASLRTRDLTASSVQIKVEEEKSLDSETQHSAETVGYFAMEPAPSDDVITFAESYGEVVMEAESFYENIPRAGKSWVVENARGNVGLSLRPLPEDGTTIDAGFTTTSPEVRYRVQFTTTGKYFIWAYVRDPDGESDSWHVGKNSAAVPTADRMMLGKAVEKWRWTKRTLDEKRAMLNIGAAGVYTLNVWMREDGVQLDRLLLTTNAKYVPSGTGPPQSPTTDVSFMAVDNQASVVGIEPAAATAAPIHLDGNYPNPFNPATTIRYTLSERAPVTLQVFNPLGQQIAVLIDESQEAGTYEVPFEADDLAAGVYFYRMRAGGLVASAPMILLP